jgi:O-antigen/teichoic acid export membrane protein
LNFVKYLKYLKEHLALNQASRSRRTKANILLLYVFHSFNFIFNLWIVPLSLDYLGTMRYGLWMTIGSLLTWLAYLDFGIGNGLRNLLGESFAKNDRISAKIYTSTAYTVFSIGSVVIILLFLIINQFVDWVQILKAPRYLQNEINSIVVYVFIFFVLQLVLRLISAILNADQKTALNGFITFLINLFSILGIYALIYFKINSFLAFSIVCNSIPVLVLLVVSYYFFTYLYTDIIPSLNNVKIKNSKSLFNLSFQFFIIQIAGLITFASSNIIITTLYGPESVAIYNVVYRYFFMITLIFNVMITPLWSAYTEAYVSGDFEWIKKTLRKIIFVWGLLSITTILMVILSNQVYKIWVGDKIHASIIVSGVTGVFIIISNWNNIFAFFLNGVGKIKLQFFLSIIIMIVNIPLALFFAQYLKFGMVGIILSSCICLLLGSVFAPLQYFKIINKQAKGIWNK